MFIIRGILGVTLRPPANAAFTPLAPELHPDLTTRERIALQTSQESCVACHAVINPLGFALEQFDAVGRRRETENGKPIDASGHYETRAGTVAQFAGARELAAFLADSEETHDAFAQQMFQQLVKQPVRAYGLEKPKRLRETFAQSGYNIRKLLVEIAVIALPQAADRGRLTAMRSDWLAVPTVVRVVRPTSFLEFPCRVPAVNSSATSASAPRPSRSS